MYTHVQISEREKEREKKRESEQDKASESESESESERERKRASERERHVHAQSYVKVCFSYTITHASCMISRSCCCNKGLSCMRSLYVHAHCSVCERYATYTITHMYEVLYAYACAHIILYVKYIPHTPSHMHLTVASATRQQDSSSHRPRSRYTAKVLRPFAISASRPPGASATLACSTSQRQQDTTV